MTIAETCLLTAGLLPYVATGIAKASGDFDNHQPREWLARQSGWRARANAAQANSFEAFAFFAAAVLLAQGRHAPQSTVDALAMGFIAARVAYLALYLADLATMRSVAWLAGLGCVVALCLMRPLSPL